MLQWFGAHILSSNSQCMSRSFASKPMMMALQRSSSLDDDQQRCIVLPIANFQTFSFCPFGTLVAGRTSQRGVLSGKGQQLGIYQGIVFLVATKQASL